MSARILILGGTGVISSAVANRAVAAGLEVTVVNRGRSETRSAVQGVRTLHADVHNPTELSQVLGNERFAAAVSFVGYSPEDVTSELSVLADRIDQYVFVSTCSVYSHPAALLPIRESSPKKAPLFEYPANKIKCETLLEAAFRDGLPVTIVRPSHVYDRTTLPVLAGWTAVERFRNGKAVVVHGDGTSLWNVMHADDFARAFVPLLANSRAIGEQIHITSSATPTWDQIHLALAQASGVKDPILVHKSSADIGKEVQWMDVVLQEDFRHTVIYDNSKLLQLVPDFVEKRTLLDGLRESVTWFDSRPTAPSIDQEIDAAFDRLSTPTDTHTA